MALLTLQAKLRLDTHVTTADKVTIDYEKQAKDEEILRKICFSKFDARL